METITTVDELVAFLGGTFAVAARLGVTPPAVSNWRARGRIPAEYFLRLSGEAEQLGRKVGSAMFGFAEARA